MTLETQDLIVLADRASQVARAAGMFIAASRPESIERKSPGGSLASQVVTEIDRGAEQLILELLAPTAERYDLSAVGRMKFNRRLGRDEVDGEGYWQTTVELRESEWNQLNKDNEAKHCDTGQQEERRTIQENG